MRVCALYYLFSLVLQMMHSKVWKETVHMMLAGDSWEGNWKGVECRFQGDEPKSKPRVVTNLHLPDFQLGGPVPMGITLLKDLIELDLDGNRLTGPMNPYIGCLSNMRELDIANNSLSGNIPTEWRFLTK